MLSRDFDYGIKIISKGHLETNSSFQSFHIFCIRSLFIQFNYDFDYLLCHVC